MNAHTHSKTTIAATHLHKLTIIEGKNKQKLIGPEIIGPFIDVIDYVLVQPLAEPQLPFLVAAVLEIRRAAALQQFVLGEADAELTGIAGHQLRLAFVVAAFAGGDTDEPAVLE